MLGEQLLLIEIADEVRPRFGEDRLEVFNDRLGAAHLIQQELAAGLSHIDRVFGPNDRVIICESDTSAFHLLARRRDRFRSRELTQPRNLA